MLRLPVMVSPALRTLREAAPVTLPTSAAVMVPALKLPEESRATMAFGVSRFVAVVAELATSPGVVRVASLLLAMAAFEAISALTINELVKLPDASLWTTPAAVKPAIETVPPDDIPILSEPLVLKYKAPALAESPVLVLPVKVSEGADVLPAGNCRVPLMVPPVSESLLLS